MLKKYAYALLVCLACGGVVAGVIHHKRKKAAEICNTKKACINDDCQCYCSMKCGFRDKTDDDRPVYIENDPNGKHCYCKQWDLDNYQERDCAAKEAAEPAAKKARHS